MKKDLLCYLTILMVAIVSVGFVSCSSDDEGDNLSIVGTWRFDDPKHNYYCILTFNADGTGYSIEKEDQKNQTWHFKYIFDTKTMTIYMFWSYEDNDYTDYDEPGHITNLTSKTMVINGHTFIKQ